MCSKRMCSETPWDNGELPFVNWMNQVTGEEQREPMREEALNPEGFVRWWGYNGNNMD
jgi:hypothetical protein